MILISKREDGLDYVLNYPTGRISGFGWKTVTEAYLYARKKWPDMVILNQTMEPINVEKDILSDSGEGFLSELDTIAQEDAAGLKKAYAEYGPSWKQRGGIGAFMMLARNWDRMQRKLEPIPAPMEASGGPLMVSRLGTAPWDIFAAYVADPAAEGMADHIRDLRRYLMLVEAEMRARGHRRGAGRHVSDPLKVQGVVTSRRVDNPHPRGLDPVLDVPGNSYDDGRTSCPECGNDYAGPEYCPHKKTT